MCAQDAQLGNTVNAAKVNEHPSREFQESRKDAAVTRRSSWSWPSQPLWSLVSANLHGPAKRTEGTSCTRRATISTGRIRTRNGWDEQALPPVAGPEIRCSFAERIRNSYDELQSTIRAPCGIYRHRSYEQPAPLLKGLRKPGEARNQNTGFH